jgi:hypothetical protein
MGDVQMQVIIGWFSGTYIELIIRWVNMTKRKHISGISWFITPSKSSDVITTRPTLNQDPNQLSYIWGGQPLEVLRMVAKSCTTLDG